MVAMGLRTSLIVALAIPLSMLMSFAILQAMDVTLNMVVLFSLVLALGMLVDNAIVIVENIYRYMQEGHSRLDAARLGAAEVAWPVITSTATTIAAFAPMLVWTGVMGEFMSKSCGSGRVTNVNGPLQGRILSVPQCIGIPFPLA